MTSTDESIASVSVLVNGDEAHVVPSTTVLAFLEQISRHPRTVAIEYNGEILPRSDYATTLLGAGDRLEIVGFVQGG